jgi:hypothetical protein
VTVPLPGPRLVPPTREAGYNRLTNYWALLDDEPTAELRWPHSVHVYDRMRRQDAQVISVIRAVMLPVLSTRWSLDPAGARDEVVTLVAEDLGLPILGEANPPRLPRTRDRFSWREHMRWALLSLVHGHMFFEQVARVEERDGREWNRLQKLAPRWPKTISRVNVADDGGLVSIEQPPSIAKPGDPVVLDVSRLVAYTNEREGGNWYGRSLLRAAYKHWLLKDEALRIWSQRDRRNSMGIPKFTDSPDNRFLTEGTQIAQDLQAGDGAGLGLPNGADLELMGVTGTLPDVEKQVRYQDEQIGRSVLAHFLNLGTQTGSWALGTTFMDFFVMSLETVAQEIRDTANMHVVEDLVDWNWGEEELAPRSEFLEIGSRQAPTAAAIQALIAAGAIFPDPDLDAFVRQIFDLPPKAPLPNPQTPAGATGGPADGSLPSQSGG